MAVESLNARTLANVIAGSTNAQEVKWLIRAHRHARGHMPIGQWFGSLNGGRPIMEVMETRKLRGQEIVASVIAGLGQRGVGIGEDRASKSEKYKHTDYKVKIGERHHSVAQEGSATDMSVIGSEFDLRAGPDLAEWLMYRQQEDVLAECFKRKHERNTLRPNNKASRDDLTSFDTFGINSVSDIKEGMLSIGANPLSVRKGPNQEVVDSYYIQGSQFLFADLNRNPQWMQIRGQAENRGSSNSVFAGGKPMIDNCIINQWEIKNNDYNATQGARIMPFAILGVAINANPDSATAATTYIYGGGNATAAANEEVDYFQNFLGAPYEGFEGEKIAATTDTEHYLAVKSMSGANKGKKRLFAYQVNNGNRITITRALSSANAGGTSLKFTNLSASGTPAVWGEGAWTTDHLTEAAMPVGSLVYQCNIKGQCLTYGLAIGSRMMLCGYGSKDGKTALGQRTKENQDFQRVVGIGILAVWGCRATEDTNNMVNGYVVYEAAYNPPGFPEITS
jgi:hypothetical protein